LAATLTESLGHEVELIAGRGGIFDVEVNGALVYSKHATGQFPHEQELVQTIQQNNQA